MKQTLRKSEVLRGKNAISSLFQNGKRINEATVRGYVQIRRGRTPGEPPCRVGFAVAGTVRRAVDRNRMKRLMRESYRRNKEALLPALAASGSSCAIMFLYSRNISHKRELPTYQQVESDIRKILMRIAEG